jgi:plasmid stabilization system protein ParE
MKRFLLTPLAEQDLNEIWEYIGDDSVEAANRVLGKIESAIYRLTEHPGLGHLREDLADRPASVLSGLFLPDRLPPWNGPVANYPGLTRCT